MLLLLFVPSGPPPVLDPLDLHVLSVAHEDRRIVIRRETRALTVGRDNRVIIVARRA